MTATLTTDDDLTPAPTDASEVDAPELDALRAAERDASRRRLLVAGAAVALLGIHSLVAFGEPVLGTLLAGLLLAVGVAIATTSEEAQVRRGGIAVAAVCMTVVATVTTPGVDPVGRLAIVALALSPFVLSEPDGGKAAWWALPTHLRRSLLVAVGMGTCFGAVSTTLEPAVDVSGRAGWALAAGLLAVALAAATEETIYRGFLLDGLGGGPGAVLLTALVGGAAAMGSGDPTVVAVAVLMGLGWGELRRRTGSLWIPVLGHVVAAVSLQLWLGVG